MPPEGSITYRYDDAYRLLSENRVTNGVPLNTSFSYDEVGNRLLQTQGTSTVRYTYNDLDQLTQEISSNSTLSYIYDARGNLSTLSEGSLTTTYTWDAMNRLTGIDLPQVSDVSYTYDFMGQRVTQTAGTDITRFVWDDFSRYGDVLLETDSTGATQTSYVYGRALLSQTQGSDTRYLLPDLQGSTRLLTDSAGTVTSSYDYDAFGELRTDESPETKYLYTGQQFDEATGFYSLRARYYDPGNGRFLSRDTWAYNTSNPFELNRYAYAANNPVNGYDPSGHSFLGYSLPSILKPTRAKVMGAFVGGFMAILQYDWIKDGKCGTNMQQMTAWVDRETFIKTSVFIGGIAGAITGYFGPEMRTLIAANPQLALQMAGVNFATGIALSFMTAYFGGPVAGGGPNQCAVLQGVMAFAAAILGILGAVNNLIPPAMGGMQLAAEGGYWAGGAAAAVPAAGTGIGMVLYGTGAVMAADAATIVNAVIVGTGGTGGGGNENNNSGGGQGPRQLKKPDGVGKADNGATENNYRSKLNEEWPLSDLPDDLEWEAHHVVPWNHPLAKDAVKVLNSKGINEHSSANLTWLPAYPDDAQIAANHFQPGPTSHHGGGVHTNSAVTAVNTRIVGLQNATQEQIMQELRSIGDGLSQGIIPR